MSHPTGHFPPLLLVGLMALAGCGDEETNTGAPEVERLTRGDTVIVRTLAGSAWPGPALVEELRLGALEGAEEEMFGPNLALAPDGRGGVYVFDGAAPALRHFDREGRYTRTLGREGSGPGEYRDVALGLAVLDDGRLFMRDPRNARINIYNAAGDPAGQWPVASGLFTSRAMVVDTAGEAYLKILTGRPERNKPWPVALLHLDTAGAIVDTVPAPTVPGEPETAGGTFLPRKVWEMSPVGDVVVGITAFREGRYGFEIRRRDGSVLRVEKLHSPVPVHPEERAELEAVNDWTRRNQSQFLTADIPPVPETKPAYRGFYFDEAGDRIWVHLHVAAEKGDAGEPTSVRGVQEPRPATSWREPTAFDVFETDGTYLGEVRIPERTSIGAIRGDEIWAVQRGELEEPYVIRYRVDTDATADDDIAGNWEPRA